MGILVKNGSITVAGGLFTISVPLLAIGKYHCIQQKSKGSGVSSDSYCPPSVPVSFTRESWTSIPFQWLLGSLLIFIAIVTVLLEFVPFGKGSRNKNENNHNNEYEEVQLVAEHLHHDEIVAKIEENIMSYSQSSMSNDTQPKDLIHCDGNSENSTKDKNTNDTTARAAEKVVVYLNALTFQISSKHKEIASFPDEMSEHCLSCQDAAYRALLSFSHSNDQVVISALSLLAIIAKHPAVCQRTLQLPDRYGLHIPNQAMERSLKRSKMISNPRKEDEFLAAELQRKASLYLGALADGDNQIDSMVSKKIIENDGLDAILNAMDWFRYHDEVVNWGLWAIFMICFENEENKQFFARMDGIQKVVQALRIILKDYSEIRKERGADFVDSNSFTVQATRHGIAILFDILRHQDEYNTGERSYFLDLVQLRRMALNAGLHSVVLEAMQSFREDTEIMMMGQQMLIATGYVGNIPEFDERPSDS